MAARNALTVMAQEKGVRHVKAKDNSVKIVVQQASAANAVERGIAYSATDKDSRSAIYAMEIKCANTVKGKAT